MILNFLFYALQCGPLIGSTVQVLASPPMGSCVDGQNRGHIKRKALHRREDRRGNQKKVEIGVFVSST